MPKEICPLGSINASQSRTHKCQRRFAQLKWTFQRKKLSSEASNTRRTKDLQPSDISFFFWGGDFLRKEFKRLEIANWVTKYAKGDLP